MGVVKTTVKRGAMALMAAMLVTGAASPPPAKSLEEQEALHRKKILIVQSYHAGYEWSAGIEKGLQSVLGAHKGIEFKTHWMDTHRNKEDAFKVQAGKDALAIIKEWQPDLIITSDDDAVKYLVEPFLNDTDLPVVFCGVNWNLDRYTLATNRNVTGIIEIAHFHQLIEALMPYAKGTRIGFIAGENVNTDAEVAALKREFPDYAISTYAARSFEEWASELAKACGEVDVLLVDNNAGIPEWNAAEAKRLIYDTVSIPTGSPNDWMANYNMLTFAKNAGEQGEWAAKTALRILAGTPPADIPVATAKKARIFLNMALAKKLGIRFPMELIENAHLIASE
jgi:ABC-type uncharacterized transport system substrate-binding protein